MRTPAACLALLVPLCAAIPAQQTRVVPDGMDFVEAPNFFAYPFGLTDAAIQILYDAERITSPGTPVVLTGMRFRPSQQTSSAQAYSKAYRVTAYHVATNAAGMVPDPTTNIGGAIGTVVFNGTLNLPAIGPLQVQPGPFSIAIPYGPSPYVYDPNLGNLLLLIETTDMNTVSSGTYRIDAVIIYESRAEGIIADIDTNGCANSNGHSMSVAVNAPASAIPGGTVNVLMSSTSTGAFPNAFALIGFGSLGFDLAPIGLAGCKLYPATPVALGVAETPGGYPSVDIGIPAVPSIEGSAVVVQAVGLAAAFPDIVFSNSKAVRIGAMTPPVRRAMMATRFASGWSMGTAGEFVPVVQFEGTFP